MKTKYFLSLFLLLLLTFSGFSQNESSSIDSARNELKINVIGIIYESLELNYEYIAGEDFTVGLAANYWWDDGADINFIFFPNARFYPSEKKPAEGFFIALSVPIMNYEDSRYNDATQRYEDVNTTNAGLGVAAGYKLLSRKNFVGEIFLGVGRNFEDNTNIDIIPRFGVTFGKRF